MTSCHEPSCAQTSSGTEFRGQRDPAARTGLVPGESWWQSSPGHAPGVAGDPAGQDEASEAEKQRGRVLQAKPQPGGAEAARLEGPLATAEPQKGKPELQRVISYTETDGKTDATRTSTN